MADDKIVISLTGRPPVRISIGRWPLASEAVYRWHGDRNVDIYVRVRENRDGRAIVYGRFLDEQSEWERAGILLAPGSDKPAAISLVAAQLIERASRC
jgi:hypothetical protein